MEHIHHTTELIGIKDKNITISQVVRNLKQITIEGKLDYPAPRCPHCTGGMIKYDFQRPSKIPILDIQGMPCLLVLKKRRFQCKACKRVVVSQTNLVKKNCQISQQIGRASCRERV